MHSILFFLCLVALNTFAQVMPGYTQIGSGHCLDATGAPLCRYLVSTSYHGSQYNHNQCSGVCDQYPGCTGWHNNQNDQGGCSLYFLSDAEELTTYPHHLPGFYYCGSWCRENADYANHGSCMGTGSMIGLGSALDSATMNPSSGLGCYRKDGDEYVAPTTFIVMETGSNKICENGELLAELKDNYPDQCQWDNLQCCAALCEANAACTHFTFFSDYTCRLTYDGCANYITGDSELNKNWHTTSIFKKESTHPTSSPTTDIPSRSPTFNPTSNTPTKYPSHSPSFAPTTDMPTSSPSFTPTTDMPTGSPSHSPSFTPTTDTPTRSPSHSPSFNPTTDMPTSSPSHSPSFTPTTDMPTGSPSHSPSFTPTTDMPTGSPSHSPSFNPSTDIPTNAPSHSPSFNPTTDMPTTKPFHSPSSSPTTMPTRCPSHSPSSTPTAMPSRSPSSSPSFQPSNIPTRFPTRSPSADPATDMPTRAPSRYPTDFSFLIEELGTYPGSDSKGYDGSVNLHFFESSVVIEYELATYDAACEQGPTNPYVPTEPLNSCGIHIHSGKSCADASQVGDHYYGGNVAVDPWTDAVYTGASGRITVEYGLDVDDAMCRALVIHDSYGSRMTCAQIGDCGSDDALSLISSGIEFAKNSTALQLSLVAIGLIIVFCCGCSRVPKAPKELDALEAEEDRDAKIHCEAGIGGSKQVYVAGDGDCEVPNSTISGSNRNEEKEEQEIEMQECLGSPGEIVLDFIGSGSESFLLNLAEWGKKTPGAEADLIIE